MPLNALHANHLGAVGGGFELQRQNNALLYVVNLAGNSNNLVTLSLASFPLPKETTNPIEIGFLNEKRKYAGLTTYDDLTIVFNDFVDKETATLLYQWRYLVKHPVSGVMGNKADYAKTGRAVKFGPNGQTDREYELQGIWPSSLDGGEIDFMAEDGVKINMTLTIDKAIYLPAVDSLSAPSVF